MKTKFLRTAAKAIACAAVALSCAADASAAVAEKAAKKNYLGFTSETTALGKKTVKATAGENFGLQIGVDATSKNLKFSAKDLPKGLSIDKKTGYISGKPKKPGAYTSKVTVKDDKGLSVSQKVKIGVLLPKWSTGAFKGRLYKTATSKKPLELRFNMVANGKVTGKAISSSGKSYSFKATCSYASARKVRFSPKIKIGSKTYQPGRVEITQNVLADEVTVVEAVDPLARFLAQKRPGLVKAGGKLAKFVGHSMTMKEKKNKYILSISSRETVTLTAVVDGKKFHTSAQLMVRNVDPGEVDEQNATYNVNYGLYAFFFNQALKDGYCAFLFELEVSDCGDIETIDLRKLK